MRGLEVDWPIVRENERIEIIFHLICKNRRQKKVEISFRVILRFWATGKRAMVVKNWQTWKAAGFLVGPVTRSIT